MKLHNFSRRLHAALACLVIYLQNSTGQSTRTKRQFNIESDYPRYSQVPSTSFTCDERGPGYFADVEAQCQVFHICYGENSYSLLCPNGTIFNQQVFVCDWWYNVRCEEAPSFYALNSIIGMREAELPPISTGASRVIPAGRQEVSPPGDSSLNRGPRRGFRRRGKTLPGFEDEADSRDLSQSSSLDDVVRGLAGKSSEVLPSTKLPLSGTSRLSTGAPTTSAKTATTFVPRLTTNLWTVDQDFKRMQPEPRPTAVPIKQQSELEAYKTSRGNPLRTNTNQRTTVSLQNSELDTNDISISQVNGVRTNPGQPNVEIITFGGQADQPDRQSDPLGGQLNIQARPGYLPSLNSAAVSVESSIGTALEKAFGDQLAFLSISPNVGTSPIPPMNILPLSNSTGTQSTNRLLPPSTENYGILNEDTVDFEAEGFLGRLPSDSTRERIQSNRRPERKPEQSAGLFGLRRPDSVRTVNIPQLPLPGKSDRLTNLQDGWRETKETIKNFNNGRGQKQHRTIVPQKNRMTFKPMKVVRKKVQPTLTQPARNVITTRIRSTVPYPRPEHNVAASRDRDGFQSLRQLNRQQTNAPQFNNRAKIRPTVQLDVPKATPQEPVLKTSRFTTPARRRPDKPDTPDSEPTQNDSGNRSREENTVPASDWLYFLTST